MRLMKNLLAMILSVCMIFGTVIPAFATTDDKTSDSVQVVADAFYGDVDGDKDVDMQDVLELEKYIADKKTKINETNADVNADGNIDDTDVKMIKDYLLGNIESLTPDLVTITFDTAGGSEIKPIHIGRGYGVVKEIPSPSKEDHIFIGWKKSDGSDFYKEDPVNEDITLIAQYENIKKEDEFIVDSYSITDCDTNVKFSVTGEFSSAAEVKANVTLVSKDGSAPIAVKVTEQGNNVFTIGAATSFTPGSSYQLELGEGLTFVDKDKNINKVNFVIRKFEGDNLQYNPDVIFIQDTEEMKYVVSGGETLNVLEANLLNNKESNDKITGTFTKSDGGIAEGDIVCIYEKVDPRDRDYTDDEKATAYQEDSIAYIRITAVNGNVYSFESLSDEDADQVLMMPDSIPFKVDVLPAGETGKVNKNGYDKVAREKLGFKEAPEFKKGDFLVFYTCDFEEATEDTAVVYGQITEISGDDITFKTVEKSYIDEFMGMFVKQDVDNTSLLENINQEKFLNSVAKKIENSGFAEESAQYMLQSAMENKEVTDAMEKSGMTKKEIEYYSTAADIFAEPTGARVTTPWQIEGINVVPTFIVGNRFKNGIGIKVDLNVVLSRDTAMGSNINSLKLDVSATFEEEIALSVDVNVEDTWKWYVFVPVLKELSCYTSVDIRNYTSVSVGATLYTVKSAGMKRWNAFSKEMRKKNLANYLLARKYDQLSMKLCKKINDTVRDPLEELSIQKQLDELEQQLPKFVVDGKEYSFSQIRESLGALNVASAFEENFGAQTDKEAKVGLQKLIDKYSEMLKNESDWIELVNVKAINKEIVLKVVAINITVRFISKASANIAAGLDIEYETGKRYNFWLHIIGRKAGSNEMDLEDERYGFQLYVMGTMGLRGGIKAELSIGLISTRLGSIGMTLETGLYVKIWGYACKVYTKNRPANTNVSYVDEEEQGAMYWEPGWYATIGFKASVLDGMFKYEPVLLDIEVPIILKKDKQEMEEIRNHEYDFAVNPENDKIRISDADNNGFNGIAMKLPEIYRRMKVVDLKSGVQSQATAAPDKFNYKTSSRKITVDEQGVITVNPSAEDRYIEGAVTITWKGDKLSFTKFDMSITVPVYWTNYTNSEINEKFTASVAVGNNTDGYKVVWSNRYTRIDKFNLPSKEKILDLINYDSFASDDINLKYSKVDGYSKETENLSISHDTTYYFDITKREYTAKVSGIQNADGTTISKTYKAYYGEAFNMNDLTSTGTDDADSMVYTVFSKLTKAGDEGKNQDEITEFPLNTTVNSSFYNTYGTGADLVANYADNSAIATYTFTGVPADPVQIKFKKGEVPYFPELDNYIDEAGRKVGEGARRMSITPDVCKVYNSVDYLVLCEVIPPPPKYKLTFATNGGSSIATQEYFAGVELFRPSDPKKTGYDFKGWYTDSACTKAFSFDTVMPENDVTLYAKWEAKKITIYYYNGDNIWNTKETTYGSVYVAIDKPASETMKFTGWFTEKTGGTEVKPGDKVEVVTDVKLYAHWDKKKEISKVNVKIANANSAGKYEVVFNNTPQPVSLKFEGGIPEDDYVIRYGVSGEDKSTEKAPTTAGIYDIYVTRKYCDNYLTFSKKFAESLIIKPVDAKLKELRAYAVGKTVTVRRPEGYKGISKISFTIKSDKESHTNSTGIFTDVSAGDYKCSVSVDKDANYDYGSMPDPVTVKVKDPEKYTIKFKVKTGTGSGAGTDCGVYGMVVYNSGDSGWKKMSTGGSVNDHENGNERTYSITTCNPWDIKGIKLKISAGSNIFVTSDKWQCSYVHVIASNNVNTFTRKVDVGNKWFSNNEVSSVYTCNFKREITPEKKLEGSADINIYDKDSYSYTESRKVKDNWCSSYYDPLATLSYPTYSMTTSNTERNSVLLNFIHYTEPGKFQLDIYGLRHYAETYGLGNFSYTLKCEFPSVSTTGTRSFSKKFNIITVNNKKSIKAVATGASKDAYKLSVDNKVSAKVGDEISVPVKISGSQPLWGVLAQVQYNTEQLELLGAEGKGILSADKFASQNDLSKDTFRFIATNDKIEDVKADGVIANLKFRVKAVDSKNGFGITAGVLQSVVCAEKEDEPVKKPSTSKVKTAKNLKKGTTLASAEKLITKSKSGKDFSGSVYSNLQTKSKKVSKTSISIKWNKVKKAKKYVVYGAECGTKLKKLKTVSSTTTSYTQKKLKKGTFYKYLVLAVDSKSKVITASKIAHITTKGGKFGNCKTINTAAKKNKVTLKKGKTFNLKAKLVIESEKLRNNKHRGVKYEVTNSKALSVNSKGKIKAKKKGTCYVYVYVQNGVAKKIKVTVK